MIPDPLLIDLESTPGQKLLAAVEERHGSFIANCAKFIPRLFLLRSLWAPGLRTVGGIAEGRASSDCPSEWCSLSLTGSGGSIEDAFAACVGEGVERLSQFERAGDVACEADWRQVRGDLAPGLEGLLAEYEAAGMLDAGSRLAWVSGRNGTSARSVLVPADWCLRRSPKSGILKPRTSLSTGTAAGRNFEEAATRALLELIERHAAHLWWLAGRNGRIIPLETETVSATTELLQRLRQDCCVRSTWILDITTEVDVPTVAAVAFNMQGTGFACGTAARTTLSEAAGAAVRELCQLEIGLQLAMAREKQAGQAQSDGVLTAADRAHLERATKVNAKDCMLVHPGGLTPNISRQKPDLELKHLLSVLKASGVEVAFVDLTRPEYSISVVYGLAPALLPLPAPVSTKLSQLAFERYGGGEKWTNGAPLS